MLYTPSPENSVLTVTLLPPLQRGNRYPDLFLSKINLTFSRTSYKWNRVDLLFSFWNFFSQRGVYEVERVMRLISDVRHLIAEARLSE